MRRSTVVTAAGLALAAIGGIIHVKKKNALVAAVALSALAGAGRPGLAAETVDPALPAYSTVSGVSGDLRSVGSDTLNNLMTFWGEGFSGLYNIEPQIDGKGSSTAPPALIEGTADLGPMSREMKPEEIDKFEAKFGYKPTGIKVALDALAVYVNKDNPVKSLTLQQVDGIFSSTRKRGGSDVANWGQAGLTGEWGSLPISLYGRNSASGTYGYFKEHVLAKGDYKSSVKESPGSAAVVQGITADRGGIGYSGIGYRTAGVRAVPIADEKAGGTPFEATSENVLSGKYPISRALMVYVNKAPGRPLPPSVAEFLRYVLSKEGQEVVLKDGFVALPANVVAEERAKLD
jgi:phosphate transport system substrate-binding protein